MVWLFEELGVEYELKIWKRGSDKLADPGLKEIHALGKSPIVTIEVPGATKPITLIESAAIFEYFLDHYDNKLVPKRYQDGKEGQIGGETESWIRYRTFMHYAEGSLMPYMVFSLVVSSKSISRLLQVELGTCTDKSIAVKEAPAPFFAKPIVNSVANKIHEGFLQPNFNTHYQWLESQLETSPDGGLYLCGKDLTAADILMSFPLEAGQTRAGKSNKECPLIFSYVDRLHEREAFKKSLERVKADGGKFKQTL